MAILPPGSSRATPQSTTVADNTIGALVQYEDDGAVVLGVITTSKPDKFGILNVRGRELELPRARLYRLPPGGSIGGATTSARVEALKKVSELIEQEANALDVKEVWTFVQDDVRLYTVSELCKSYFGADTAEKHAGIRIALIREKVHFKRDKDGFEPRSAEVVDGLLRAEEARKRKVSLRDATIAFIAERVKDQGSTIPHDIHENLVLMSEVAAAVAHTDPARQKEGRELVNLCARHLKIPENLAIERQAFEVLLKTGYFNRDTNLSFIRHEIPTHFSHASIEEASTFVVPATLNDFPDDERSIRQDLTSRHTITIDDISTQDMDDAISVEQTADGYELGIHITDVSWAIQPGTALDEVARRRATSIYCADRTVNMLPEALSELKLSLRQGQVRPCISVLVSLSQNLEVQSSRIVPSFIKVAQRYTYDDVDLLLEHEDPTVSLLYQISAAHEESRIRNGATRVHRREVVPFLEADGSVRLLEIEEESPARSLVAEMMVLANSVMASFAAEHQIPVVFRGQERADGQEGEAASNAPAGPAKDFSARSKLKKSTMTFEPRYHATLGLNAYSQSTSPIRRYMDLCHQRQFLAFFKRGKPWMSRSELEPLANEVEVHLNAATLASRETRRYWLLRYLEGRPRGKTIEGTVVRQDTKSPLVELDEVYLTFFVKSSRPTRLGQTLTLKIGSIDPQADYIRLEVV